MVGLLSWWGYYHRGFLSVALPIKKRMTHIRFIWLFLITVVLDPNFDGFSSLAAAKIIGITQ